MWKLATSELLSTFFPTWRNGKPNDSYWLNTHSHPVLSSYYPPHVLSSFVGCLTSLDTAFLILLCNLISHYIFCFASWYWLLSKHYDPLCSVFGAVTLTFGAYSLKQQPCIIYTLAWFPLTLIASPIISALAVGMMLLSGYYPFAIYLLPVSALAHLLWYQEAWLILGVLIGMPQLYAFVAYLPKTIKKVTAKCESPEVERRFYVGIIPILLIPFSTSRVWPLTVMSALFSLGLFKHIFPRVHERWLIVLQFCIGWMAVNGLNNLNLNQTNLVCLVGLHLFDIFWHNRECFPPRPWCELWQRPSRVFNTKLTRFLDENLGDYRVAGLPWPLFTGLVNGFKTMGYQGSMQLKLMAKWRGTSGSHGIEGISLNDLTNYRVRYAYGRKRPDKWRTTEIKNLYRNPNL